MSGHKIASVTISQEEYRRLYDLEKNLQYQIDAVVQQPNQVDIDQFETHIKSEIAQKNSEYENLISHYRVLLAENQDEFSAQIREVENRVAESITNLVYRDRANVELLESKLDQQFFMIDGIVEELGNAFDQVSFLKAEQQNGLASRDEISRQVSELANFSSDLIDHISRTYPRHLIDEKTFLRSEELLRNIGDNFRSGYFEAGLSQAQYLAVELEQLRSTILCEYLKHLALLGEMASTFNQLVAKYQDHSQFQAIDDQGNFLGQVFDLNQWTMGRYAEIGTELNQWLDKIQSDYYDLRTEEVVEIINHTIPQLDQAVSDCLTEGRLRVINAQRRYEIANKIMLGLISQGYRPVEGAYEENDFRKGYLASVTNGTSTINLYIEPVADNPDQNHVHVMSLDWQELTQHELARRASEIRASIQSQDLVTSSFKEVDPQRIKEKRQPFRKGQERRTPK